MDNVTSGLVLYSIKVQSKQQEQESGAKRWVPRRTVYEELAVFTPNKPTYLKAGSHGAAGAAEQRTTVKSGFAESNCAWYEDELRAQKLPCPGRTSQTGGTFAINRVSGRDFGIPKQPSFCYGPPGHQQIYEPRIFRSHGLRDGPWDSGAVSCNSVASSYVLRDTSWRASVYRVSCESMLRG